MVRRVFIVQSNGQYDAMFNNHDDYMVVDQVEQASFIQFTGGNDVTPSYYGEEGHPTTYNNPLRDEQEATIFKTAFGSNTPMAGICRGGQFLHVMNGGKLYQNVSGHCGNHLVRDVWDDRTYQVSSTHHQMMRDAYVEDGAVSKILAVAEDVGGYKEYMRDGDIHRIGPGAAAYDLEAIYYPITNSLCFQPHPEFDGVEECRSLYFQYLDEFIFNTE